MGSIRMTGMISGLDTESLIKELVNAQKLKNKKVSDKLTKSEWKEDKWKELNTKLYKLYTDDLSKLRLQSSYKTKSVTASNENLVSVTSDVTVSDGVHNLTVSKLASAQYLTGKVIDKAGVTSSSKLVSDLGMVNGTLITIETKTGEKTIDVNANTTINDFVQNCKDLGLNANYDVNQKRFFISSKTSGAENGFTITTTNDSGIANRRNIDQAVGYSSLSSADKTKIDEAYEIIKENSASVSAIWDDSTVSDLDDEITKSVKNAVNSIKEYAQNKYKTDTTVIATDKVKSDIVQAIKDKVDYEGLECKDVYNDELEQAKKELIKKYDNESLDFDDEAIKSELDKLVDQKILARASEFMQTDEAKNKIQAEQVSISENGTIVTSVDAGGNPINTVIPSNAMTMEQLKTDVLAYSQSTVSGVTGELSKLGLAEITKYVDSNNEVKYSSSSSEVTLVEATDSKVTYNGAELTGSSNTIIVNGLTLNLKGTTAPGETISLTVSNNTQANYDMVKNFIKSYNEILKEMNTLYYADSSSGYDPLSDDEKEAMSEGQIEKWETKIKDSILRRDSVLGSVITGMKQSMSSSIEVAGKKYSLSSYGIQTSTDYTEKGLLHIFGDEEDSVYSTNDDKLMKALEEDPDTVISVLSGISKNLYDTMNDKMKAIPNVRSAFSFYNDKLMDKEQTDYKKRITVLESKLTDMENKYYKQFSAMETTLAKLQSQSSALAGMLGTSTTS
ncbi:MAG: flagellar filament capping protein FliD [Anaerocolumna sp.]